ncbi:response regulator transcription factor [Pontibacillus litoralis]|uniref:Transcriptional regulator n=1 Tax=Pontibacillus litoralis JSM 072002 TaxID=1385512 RepID=A0A0A5HV94_9BACI|nr:response regulator transcription factor [Pontibacillus litoralis]KGX87527.1 transcriptional regulator [Pontibacillus litoralis JSM 072002]
MLKDRILIVDDEQEMIQLLKSYLRGDFEIYTANDGEEAIYVVQNHEIDLVLLDIMMPNMDGMTACKEIRSFSDVPILLLTAKSEEYDRVEGLRSGADDYIVKPFSPKELLARIEAVLRRSKGFKRDFTNVLQFEEIHLNIERHIVKVKEKEVVLTRKEFHLLQLFMSNPGHVYTREQLLDKIWGLDTNGTIRTVDTHIKTLRIKLQLAGKYIKTVWGVGYKFE